MRKHVRLALPLALSALLLVACGDGDSDSTEPEAQQGGGVTEGGDWPEPMTIYVPASAGGGFDIAVRALQPILAEELGNDVVVVNLEGAGGAVAGQQMLSEPADGNRMEIVSRSVIAVPYTGTPEFDPLTLLSPVGVATQDVSAVTVPADAPYDTIEEFLDAARAKPGEITIGTSGTGGVWHAAGLQMAEATDTEFQFIPYKGGAPAGNALVAGEIDAVTISPAEVRPFVDAGEAKVLAVMGEERSALFPDAPTLVESGVDVNYAVWRGYVVDKETPEDIRAELEKRLEVAVTSDEYAEAAEEAGFEVAWADSEEFRTFMEEEDQLIRQLFEGEDFFNTKPDRVK